MALGLEDERCLSVQTPYQLRSPFSACRSLPETRSFTLVACSLRGRLSLSAVLAAAFYGFPPSPPASIRVSGCTGASGSLVSVLAQNLGPVRVVRCREPCLASTAPVPHLHSMRMCSSCSLCASLQVSPRPLPAPSPISSPAPSSLRPPTPFRHYPSLNTLHRPTDTRNAMPGTSPNARSRVPGGGICPSTSRPSEWAQPSRCVFPALCSFLLHSHRTQWSGNTAPVRTDRRSSRTRRGAWCSSGKPGQAAPRAPSPRTYLHPRARLVFDRHFIYGHGHVGNTPPRHPRSHTNPASLPGRV